MPNFEKLYTQISAYTKANDYYGEIVLRGTDIFSIIFFFEAIETRWARLSPADQQKVQNAIQTKLDEYFNEYNRATDEKIFASLLRLYAKNVDLAFLPEDFKTLMNKTSQEELINKIYRKSIFSNQAKIAGISSGLNTKKLKTISQDQVFQIFRSLKKQFESKVEPYYTSIQKQIDGNMKTFMAGIMEMHQGQPLWADANKMLRVSYGKVEGFEPMDGVTYSYYTTLEGIMQKDNPAIYDYNVPQALRNLYHNKDYGRYGKNGQMNVCFTASNHTTGGNSGSPVIDANGNLIGVNFDRCWEGTMSDLMFDPERCRNIILDIRYALFITDKLAGAGYLLDEMVIE